MGAIGRFLGILEFREGEFEIGKFEEKEKGEREKKKEKTTIYGCEMLLRTAAMIADSAR